mmetsp:Transcript_20729/g.52521  ORF Transcript_20729/g.52521 Transcript_20729/m.52521 type:complete len:130 (+) Transcript_20729:108-497(+)
MLARLAARARTPALGRAQARLTAPVTARMFSAPASGRALDEFVREAMGGCGLEEFADDTINKLKDAQVINTTLLFKLTDGDLKGVGLSVGAARALKEAIADAKRAEIVARTGERAEIRRALSAREKRGF